MEKIYNYFDDNDFKKAVPACSIEDMDKNLLFALDYARHEAGIPFIINSAYRSVEWEKSRGRNGLSSHTKGKAVDIRCNCSYDRLIIVKALMNMGLNRIGVYDTFIHVDNDLTKARCLFIGK